MSKERIFMIVIDCISLIAIITATMVTNSDVKICLFLGVLFLNFISYHIVSLLLIKRLKKEEKERLVDEVIEEMESDDA